MGSTAVGVGPHESLQVHLLLEIRALGAIVAGKKCDQTPGALRFVKEKLPGPAGKRTLSSAGKGQLVQKQDWSDVQLHVPGAAGVRGEVCMCH